MRLERHIKQAAEHYGMTVSEYAKFAAEMVAEGRQMGKTRITAMMRLGVDIDHIQEQTEEEKK